MLTLSPFKLYLSEYEGEVFAFTIETLRDVLQFVDTEVVDAEGKAVVRLQTIEEAAASIGPGHWCEIVIYKPNFGHQIEAESLILETDEKGNSKHNVSKLPGARCAVLVQRWDLAKAIPGAEPTIEGFEALPIHVAGAIDSYLREKMQPTAFNHPAFTKAWSAKQEALQAAGLA